MNGPKQAAMAKRSSADEEVVTVPLLAPSTIRINNAETRVSSLGRALVKSIFAMLVIGTILLLVDTGETNEEEIEDVVEKNTSSTTISAPHYHQLQSCSSTHPTKSRLEIAQDVLNVEQDAFTRPFGECQGEPPTSLSATAANFGALPVQLNDRFLQFSFYAHSNVENRRTHGGDAFVVTMWAMDDNQTIYKTAADALDQWSGLYVVSLPLMAPTMTSYNLTLTHLYTCHEGYMHVCYGSFAYECHNYTVLPKHRVLDFGPVVVNASINIGRRSQAPIDYVLPPCDNTQKGLDQLATGYWKEYNTTELTVESLWQPCCCTQVRKLNLRTLEGDYHLLGDSTLPHGISVNYPYHGVQSRPDFNKWTDYLSSVLNKAPLADVLVLQFGLHHLYHGFQTRIAASLVIQMVCQAALVFPGRVLMLSANPVQQQLFDEIDMTDLHVRVLNAVVRKEVEGAGGKLSSLCQHVDLLTMHYETDDDGNLIRLNTTRKTKEERDLSALLSKLSVNRDIHYGNRTVWLGDTHPMLKPRAEQYRDTDKVHDGAALMFGQHENFVLTMLYMRALGDV
jgi:hypothetical protein